jgi:hypothetical protein
MLSATSSQTDINASRFFYDRIVRLLGKFPIRSRFAP